METHDAFKDRERALEEGYFRVQDARLLEKLRARATLGELAMALRDKLHVDDPALLKRIGELGVDVESAPALLLAPLVQVAWADGSVMPEEREIVLAVGAARGLVPGSMARAQLEAWLDERPPRPLFEVAIAAIKAGLSVLPPAERDERVHAFLEECKRIARAAGGLAGLFGMGGMVSGSEAKLLDTLAAQLRQTVA